MKKKLSSLPPLPRLAKPVIGGGGHVITRVGVISQSSSAPKPTGRPATASRAPGNVGTTATKAEAEMEVEENKGTKKEEETEAAVKGKEGGVQELLASPCLASPLWKYFHGMAAEHSMK